jgi:hypothetical protein
MANYGFMIVGIPLFILGIVFLIMDKKKRLPSIIPASLPIYLIGSGAVLTIIGIFMN